MDNLTKKRQNMTNNKTHNSRRTRQIKIVPIGFSNLRFIAYEMQANNKFKLFQYKNFDAFNADIQEYNIFVNGGEFIENHTKRLNVSIEDMIDNYMSKFVTPENELYTVFTFNISVYQHFRQKQPFDIFPEHIPDNTVVSIEYNSSALLVFLPIVIMERYVLKEIYKEHRGAKNLYVSTDSFKVNKDDLKYDYVNVLEMTSIDIEHLNTLKYDQTFKPITRTTSSTSNNFSLPTSPTNNSKPFLGTRRRSSPMFRTNSNSIKHTKEKKRMSVDLSISRNSSGNMMYHDFNITEIPCKENANCFIGECVNNKCESVFSTKHINTGLEGTIYAFNGIQIFKTDNNAVSVSEFYKMLNNDKIRMTKLFPYDTGKTIEIINNIGLENIKKELFDCELFIDYMNVMRFDDVHNFNILSNSLLNIILNEKISVKTVVTIQSHMFIQILEHISETNLTYNIDDIRDLTIDDQIINVIVFSDRLTIIVTPTPLNYRAVNRSINKYSLELDDYMLYYLYTNLRNPAKRNVYLSKDRLTWVVPKSYNIADVKIEDIFNERNDIKISNEQTLKKIPTVTTYNQYLKVTGQHVPLSNNTHVKNNKNSKNNSRKKDIQELNV